MSEEYFAPAREPLVLPLPRPVAYKGGSIAQLRLHEPTARQVHTAEMALKAGGASRRAYEAKLLSLVSGVELEALAAIGMLAFTRASAFLATFVQEGLPGLDEVPQAKQPEDTLTITLAAPIVANGVTYSELTVVEPTLEAMSRAEGHLKDNSLASVRQYQISLVERACGVHPLLAGMLPISILNRAAVFAQGFSEAAPETGASSSEA